MSTETVRDKARRRWRWALEIAVLGALILAVHAYQVRTTAVGLAPPLTGIDMQGRPVDLAHFRGRPVLLYFWASWCPICRYQQPVIKAVAQDWAVLSVAWEDGQSAAALRDYVQKAGFEFPVLQDSDGILGKDYGVRAVPTAFIIDPSGQIRFTEVGYTTGPGLRTRLWLADMLARLSAAESP